MDGDIGIGSDNLLFGRQLSTLLEFEVTNGSRECEIAIDSSKVNEAAGSGDTSLLS